MGLRFNKKLFVKIVNKGTADEFFNTDSDPAVLADSETTTILGEYQLVKMVKVVNRTEIVK